MSDHHLKTIYQWGLHYFVNCWLVVVNTGCQQRALWGLAVKNSHPLVADKDYLSSNWLPKSEDISSISLFSMTYCLILQTPTLSGKGWEGYLKNSVAVSSWVNEQICKKWSHDGMRFKGDLRKLPAFFSLSLFQTLSPLSAVLPYRSVWSPEMKACGFKTV